MPLSLNVNLKVRSRPYFRIWTKLDSEATQTTKPNIAKLVLVLLLPFTCFIVWAKIGFEYYNLLFPILSMFTMIVTLKKYGVSKGYKVVFISTLAINLLCLAVPDKSLYKLRKNHRYFWSEEPLDLSHFKVKRNIENDTVAIVNPIIVGGISKVYNYPPAILITSDYIGRSWIDTTSFDDTPESKKALKALLNHEKQHFDIMEIYTREAQDSLNQMIFCSITRKNEVLDYFLKISDSVQNVFDQNTDHGAIEEKNTEWNYLLKDKLKKPQ